MTIGSGIWLLSALGLAGAGVFGATFTALTAPSRIASRLGRRGKRRMDAIAKNSSWAKIEPVVRWLGVQIARFIPESLDKSLDAQILHAGDYLGLLPQECVALMILSGLGGLVLGALLDVIAKTHGMAVLGFGALAFIAPYFELTGAVQKRFVGINRSLPYAVDLFALAMSAGLDFPGAVRQYAGRAMPDDPLAEDVDFILQMLQLGHTRKAALLDFAERCPTEAVREFVATVVHAEEKGHPLADALLIQAGVSRMRRTVRAEEEASKAAVKLIGPLTLVFGAMLVLIVAPIFIKVTYQLKTRAIEAVVVHASESRPT